MMQAHTGCAETVICWCGRLPGLPSVFVLFTVRCGMGLKRMPRSFEHNQRFARCLPPVETASHFGHRTCVNSFLQPGSSHFC